MLVIGCMNVIAVMTVTGTMTVTELMMYMVMMTVSITVKMTVLTTMTVMCPNIQSCHSHNFYDIFFSKHIKACLRKVTLRMSLPFAIHQGKKFLTAPRKR